MYDPYELHMYASDDGFTVEHGKLLGVTQDSRKKVIRVRDEDLGCTLTLYAFKKEALMKAEQNGTQVIVTVKNHKSFTWNKFYEGAD